MEIMITILLITLVFVIKGVHDKRKWYKNIKLELKNEWGKVPKEEYTSEKFRSLAAYYNTIKKPEDVDHITWNDNSMDEIFMLLNHTESAIGEEYLFAMLHQLQFDNSKLIEREKLMNFFEENQETRVSMQFSLWKMGKISSISVYEYINRLEAVESSGKWPHIFMVSGFLISLGLIAVNPAVGGTLSVILFLHNVYQYYRTKGKIEVYFTICAYIIRLLDGINDMAEFDNPELKEYTAKLNSSKAAFKQFRNGSFLVGLKSASGNLSDLILDYLKIIFHMDLIKFYSMIDCFKENRKALNEIYETVGLLDSCIAAASFRKMMPFYSIPELEQKKKPFIEAEEVYHPMIEKPVLNSIHTNGSVLITGSNASGKSTFIKTLAINAILAQTINTSLSSSYKASFFLTMSSMALQDNLLGNESYYIVEIKSLKRIMDKTNDKIPVLCFVDEVLRGTNTLERIAASSQILYHLSKANTICFAATHDIELTHILESSFANYHFKEQIADRNVLFDYKLIRGRAVSKNAIKLLEVMGYPEEVTEKATRSAAYFLKEGKWTSVS